MTIRDFFSAYRLSTARIEILTEDYDLIATCYPTFNDLEDEELKKFDAIADLVITGWYLASDERTYVFYVGKY